MNKPTRYFSKSQERRVARQLDGKRQPNSGATPFYKGDVVTQDFLIECKTKTTDCKSFTVKEDWLLKNEEEAFAMAYLELGLSDLDTITEKEITGADCLYTVKIGYIVIERINM